MYTTIRYLEELTSFLGPQEVCFVSQIDKCCVRLLLLRKINRALYSYMWNTTLVSLITIGLYFTMFGNPKQLKNYLIMCSERTEKLSPFTPKFAFFTEINEYSDVKVYTFCFETRYLLF
jgi:hypothetical protein